MDVAFNKLNIPFTRLFDMSDGFKAVCRNTEDADILLGASGISEMAKIGIQVLMPPEVKAQRTVFVRQLENEFGRHTAEEMKINIEQYNNWIKIDEVIKIKEYTHVVKIRFTETNITDRVLTNGFLGFNMSVTPDQIKREHFVNLLTCFICYEYETHATKDCPTKNLKICSECAQTGHTFRECTEEHKACINCKRQNNAAFQSHRTLAMSCPHKKQLIRSKEEEEKKKQEDKRNSTYASIAKRAVAEVVQPQPQPTSIVLGDTKDYKVMVSILYAHVMNLACPGTFAQEMNKMLSLNGLEEMNFPDNPPSGQLLRATTSAAATVDSEQILGAVLSEGTGMGQEVEVMESGSDSEEEETLVSHSEDSATTSQLDIDVEQAVAIASQSEGAIRKTSTIMKKAESIPIPTHFDELGMTVYCTHNSKGLLQRYEDMLEGIQKQQIKWTYTNERYTPTLVEAYLFSTKLKSYNRNFKLVDALTFKRINNGLVQEQRSPPAVTSQTKKQRAT